MKNIFTGNLWANMEQVSLLYCHKILCKKALLSVSFLLVLTGKSLAWSDTLSGHFCYNENYFNWKFVAEYGKSYFILKNDFITCNTSLRDIVPNVTSNCKTRYLSTMHYSDVFTHFEVAS